MITKKYKRKHAFETIRLLSARNNTSQENQRRKTNGENNVSSKDKKAELISHTTNNTNLADLGSN